LLYAASNGKCCVRALCGKQSGEPFTLSQAKVRSSNPSAREFGLASAVIEKPNEGFFSSLLITSLSTTCRSQAAKKRQEPKDEINDDGGFRRRRLIYLSRWCWLLPLLDGFTAAAQS